ncbi:hypothetical protein [Streptomyces sp. NBC_01718]|uniref:hypothetical protein n=1 Tax=Streptomyces sp. NBC_01718 TaxID=2975919 RepID=UPI00352E2FB6
MDTYAYGYGRTGHYAKPGTHTSYCGRELMHEPNNGIRNRICQPCAKAERADRVAAEQVAADHAIDGPTLAERARVAYATVGTGRRIHCSPRNDETLCGREITEYVDGSDLLALFNKGHELCVPCDRAAEKRAYALSLAAASPLAAAAVELAETVEQADAEAEAVEPLAYLRATVRTERGDWNTDRVTALFEAAGINTDRNSRWGLLRHLAEAEHLLTASGRGTFTAATAEQAAAAVEARYGAELVTEAEATAGTWRGEWIGQAAADGALFTLAPDREQGALFA